MLQLLELASLAARVKMRGGYLHAANFPCVQESLKGVKRPKGFKLHSYNLHTRDITNIVPPRWI